MTVLITGGILVSEVKENSLSAVPLEADSDIRERYICRCFTACIVHRSQNTSRAVPGRCFLHNMMIRGDSYGSKA